MKHRSSFLAAFTVIILLLLPLAYFTVSYQLDNRNDDEALLKRITFIGGSIQRYIKNPEEHKGIETEIDEAFRSSELVYPALLQPGEAEMMLARSYLAVKSCWETIKTTSATTDGTFTKEGELCWLQGNHALFDLHNVMKAKSKRLLNTLFMLGLFGSLLILYLLYLIYRYVRVDLETNQRIDLQTGLYNTQAFLEECTVHALTARREHASFSVVLMVFDKQATRKRPLRQLLKDLHDSCRREEKLFRLSPVAFALLTSHAHAADLVPLTERLQRMLKNDHLLALQTEEYSPDTDAEAFGLACLAEAEALQA
ncbi:nucleotidyl cyclase domain-containing protein [Thiomicrolovo sp. ZZH C-3]